MTRLNLIFVANLVCFCADIRAKFLHTQRWIRDLTAYDNLQVRDSKGAPSSSLSDEHIDLLISTGVIKPIRRADVRGHVHVFGVPELAKGRIRAIKHTRDNNEQLGKDTLMKLKFPMKGDICGLVHKGECFIALDFASFYDQFEYTPEIGSRFCFRRGNTYYRLNTLAMGQRQAVEVAALTMEMFINFERRTTVLSIIDNVIFVGSREDVIRDATIFIERVSQCGGQLNEDISNIPALVATSGVWGGIEIDCTAKTARLAQKTVDKTFVSWSNRASWTWRTFASHLGLLFWAWQIIELPMPHFFVLLRFISAMSSRLTLEEALWDEPASIPPHAWPVLEQWTMLVFANRARNVPAEEQAEWIVATDASEYGWGYFAVCTKSGEVRTHGERWTHQMRLVHGARLGTSTFTEPQGIVNALCHLLDRNAPTRAVILTDNTVAQASFQRGYNGKSPFINECMVRLNEYFGARFIFEFKYLPGEVNPADSYSRGRDGVAEHSDEVRAKAAAELQRYMGFHHDQQATPIYRARLAN